VSKVATTVEPLSPGDEQLDRSRVVEVDADVGAIWVERDAELMTPSLIEHGHWATEVTGLMRNVLRHGMTFIDVGANIGYFSVLASKLVGPSGRVYCVEADPANVAILRANLSINGCQNARVFPVAAWTEQTELNMRTSPEGGAGSSVGFTDEKDAKAAAFRIDELIDGPVDYMKVDCESTDHMVVSGAEGVISANPSMLITVEFNPKHVSHTGHTPTQILDIYRGLGLRPYAITSTGVLKPTTYRRLASPDSGDGQVIFDFALSRRLPTHLLRLHYAERFAYYRYRVVKAAGDLLDHVPERLRPPIRTRDRRPRV
jgi:FkbM family methyltransferase